MLDGIGGLIISVIGYINLKRGKPGFVNAELQKATMMPANINQSPKRNITRKGNSNNEGSSHTA